jgi:membrane glycosyltransferase
MAGSALELLLTTLTAPVMMLLHSRFVAEVMLGRNSGWGPQRRAGDGEPFADVLRAHGVHTVVGILLAGIVGWNSPAALAWLAPVVVGLVLAAPLSWLGGLEAAGAALRRRGLLRVPEEGEPPAVVRAVGSPRCDAERSHGGRS